ncbi:cadmium resistance transporter, partial [Nostoc piscinale]|uniref:cadmium resistance transporter n=1 Tax=Nostoc piscinale TaxID=224012 RepID=UPI0039A6CFA9
MNWLTSTIIIGISAAIATTFDDNLYLTAFFGKVNRHFRPQNIILGEFLGFTVLVLASLPGFLGGLILPTAWIGLLGFLPIAIGINHLLTKETEAETIQTVSVDFSATKTKHRKKSLWATLRDPQTYRVSAVTIA